MGGAWEMVPPLVPLSLVGCHGRVSAEMSPGSLGSHLGLTARPWPASSKGLLNPPGGAAAPDSLPGGGGGRPLVDGGGGPLG